MTQIYANNFTTLVLGRRGENLARKVVFDVRDLESLYGTGDVEVIYQRPCDAQPYPLTVQREGTIVTWDVTSTDTEMSDGSGKCELRYYVGETLAKSKTWRTLVEPAMDTPSETAPPEPEQGWVDQIISVGAAAKASADAAKADADRAAALAAEVSEKAAQTAQDASDAAKAMEAAQTAQRLAEEAQGAAETARTAAETAQAAAEQSATDAAGAKQDAETALKSAQDAAAAAANALESIQTLYQEMQTWAQGVIQDVNAAGSIAVQSVQSAGDAQVQRVTDEGETQTANAKAQADSAAQSAAGAAQSAQQAEESAAVYDDVVVDVNQLKQDLSAEQTAREQADTSLQQEISAKLPKSPADWEPWTTEEQAAARERIGIPGDYELIERFTMTEAGAFDRNSELDGTPYNFKKLLVSRTYPDMVDVSEASGWSQLYFFNSKGKYIRSECGIPSKSLSSNFSFFENDHNISIVKYSRTYGYSTGIAYLCSKPKKGIGWDIEFGNCVRVVVPSSDTEPTGTIVEIYGVRA